MEKKNTAVLTVVGNDTIGIIAKVSNVLANNEANILDISQTVLSGMFNMIMIVDISLSRFALLEAELKELGAELGLQIRIQLFNGNISQRLYAVCVAVSNVCSILD